MGGTLTLESTGADVFTPGSLTAAGAAPPPGSDLARVQDALRVAQRARNRAPSAPVAPTLASPLAVPPGAGRRGGANAPVVVHVFVDYQGPFDARFAPSLDRLHEEFGDRVLIVMRNNPLAEGLARVDAALAAAS